MIRKWTIILAFAAGSFVGCSELKHSDQVEKATENWNQTRARVKLQLAQRSFEATALDDALKHCTEVLSLDPGRADAHLLMARIRFERGQLAMAENALIQASAGDPQIPELLYLRGHLAECKSQPAEAAEFYRQAFELKSDDVRYLLTCAESLIAADRYADALEVLMRRRTEFEQNPAIHLLTGQVYELMGRPGDAADAYLAALDNAPNDDLLREAAGLALIAAGRVRQALTLIEPSDDEATDRTWPILSRALAEALMKNGQYFDAITLLRQATRGQDARIVLRLLLAEAYMATDQFELAGPVLNDAVSRDPDHVEARLLSAYHAFATGRFEMAILGAEQIVNQHPDDLQARSILARALERDPAKAHLAAQQYRHILSLDSSHPWARQRLDALAQNTVDQPERGRMGQHPLLLTFP